MTECDLPSGKADVMVDALIRLFMSSVTDFEEQKKKLVNNV